MNRTIPSLGKRGGGWVVIQFSLLALMLVAGYLGERWAAPERLPLLIGGIVIAVLGAALLTSGFVGLGPSLTPYPRPKNNASLRAGAGYRLVRHPIYGGLLLIGIGWGLSTSVLGMLPLVCLAIVLDFKSRREELWLLERFPAYAQFRQQVPSRFLPWVW